MIERIELPEFPAGLASEAEALRPELPSNISPTLVSDAPDLNTQIGQMILAGFNGQQLTPASPIIKDVKEARIGSVALFGRNIASARQVSLLTSALQSIAEIPLIISVDQEGGQVRRLGSIFGLNTNYSAAQLGRLNDLGTTHSFAEITAKTLKQVGINLNLAPVVDVLSLIHI